MVCNKFKITSKSIVFRKTFYIAYTQNILSAAFVPPSTMATAMLVNNKRKVKNTLRFHFCLMRELQQQRRLRRSTVLTIKKVRHCFHFSAKKIFEDFYYLVMQICQKYRGASRYVSLSSNCDRRTIMNAVEGF
jgi:hypothetical protein